MPFVHDRLFLLFLIRHLLLLCVFSLVIPGCTGSLLKKYTPQDPAGLKVRLYLTNENQAILLDTLAGRLSERLQVFAEHRGDFFLVKNDSDNADFYLDLHVRDLRLIASQQQRETFRKIRKMEKDADTGLARIPGAEIAAANVIANVIPNLFLIPLGYVSVTVVRPKDPDQYKEDQVFFRAQTMHETAAIAGDVSLKTAEGEFIYRDLFNKRFTLNHLVPVQEQISILSRNVLLSLEEELPFFKAD